MAAVQADHGGDRAHFAVQAGVVSHGVIVLQEIDQFQHWRCFFYFQRPSHEPGFQLELGHTQGVKYGWHLRPIDTAASP